MENRELKNNTFFLFLCMLMFDIWILGNVISWFPTVGVVARALCWLQTIIDEQMVCVCVCVIHSRAQTVCSIYYISNGANISPKTMSKNGEIFFGARRVRASLLCTFGFWHSIFGILAAFHLYLWEWCKPVAFWTNVIITGRHSFGGFFSSFIDQLLWWAFVFGRHQLLKWIGLLCDRLYLAMLTRKGESSIRHPAWFLFQKSSFQPNFIWHLCTHHVLSHKYSIHLSFIHAVNLHHTIINLLVGRFKATLHPLFYILQSHKNRSELIFTRHIRASNSQQQKKRQCNNNEMCSGTMTINTETDRTKTTKEMPHIFRLITFRYHIDVNYDENTESLKRISLIWSWEREREREKERASNCAVISYARRHKWPKHRISVKMKTLSPWEKTSFVLVARLTVAAWSRIHQMR